MLVQHVHFHPSSALPLSRLLFLQMPSQFARAIFPPQHVEAGVRECRTSPASRQLVVLCTFTCADFEWMTISLNRTTSITSTASLTLTHSQHQKIQPTNSLCLAFREHAGEGARLGDIAQPLSQSQTASCLHCPCLLFATRASPPCRAAAQDPQDPLSCGATECHRPGTTHASKTQESPS